MALLVTNAKDAESNPHIMLDTVLQFSVWLVSVNSF